MPAFEILVVDDKDDLRGLAVDFFEVDYPDANITTCSDGQEALKEIQGNKQFALLYTDLEMPNLNGVDLIKALRESGTNIPIVLSSGNHQLLKKAAHTLGVTTLKKPFKLAEFQAAVRSELPT